jgi:hypothetical protein
MGFWGDRGDFFLPSLFRCKSYSFQLIYDHQHGPTWSSPDEVMESSTSPLTSSQLAVMLQRQFDEEDHLLAAERAELLVAAGGTTTRI